MNKSENIGDLVVALSRAQGEFPVVPFNAVNPFLHNQYADLGSVIATAKEILSNHGLAVSQLVTSDGDRVGVTTVLAHTSGQWISDTVTLPVGTEKGKSLAQVAGSIITYLRRYGYVSILGLYAGDDDDGGAANGDAEKKAPPKQESQSKHQQKAERLIDWFDGSQKPAEGLADMKNISAFLKKFVGAGLAFENNGKLKNELRARFNVDDLRGMTWEKLAALINHIKGNGDDPRWYAEKKAADTEEKSDVFVETISSSVDLDALAQEWKGDGATFAGLEAALQERINDMLALVDAKAIEPTDYKAMIGVLDA